ncbi:PEP-CTERM protein-sorting domain-containing protein [Duganella sp. CF517]|uniref:NF038120 family PEP-CTERM protein n=1 Tax=Duganella sp. CF517 TaxID=1881038 RepID=UPI0008C0FF52|nr:NF038120 family PEP-CTERM protein [Duganella sp. CF517]SEN47663.1 PEP-CTERM protein-sorting domain-containing protein [Duganella sp. CF517]
MKRSSSPIDAPRAASSLRLTPLVRATILAGLTMAALPSARAADVTIDFNGLPPIGLTHADAIVSQGFNIGAYSPDPDAQAGDAVGAIIDGTDSVASCGFLQCPASNSSYASFVNDGYLELTSTTPGATFGVKSFDASFLGSNAYDYPALPGFLRVQGFYADNSTVWEDYRFYPPGSEGFEFNSYEASSLFSTAKFTSLYFFAFVCDANQDCSAFDTGLGQFAIDNITTTSGVAAPVPEPSTWLMMGAGLLGVVGAARRRKQVQASTPAV